MKKAKIFLTALAVLTVVGGAFAFKAKQESTFARTCHIPSMLCILDTFNTLETTTNQGVLATYDLYGTPCKPNGECETFTKTSI